ncbi:MAG: SDR family NAD(P)-dependent oxidoreductase [Dehalococcoidia bacterium]|nr:SDR family NAD(P)-dependent oxidoreductase [Dehalococcoidia bacterium]
MGILDGKVAIVTGAGQGIGRGAALALSKEGASVVLTDIQGAACQRTAGEITAIGGRAVPVTCDVSRRDQVKTVVAAAVREFGTVDILVNAAQAMRNDVPFQDTTDDDMQLALGTGLMGTFYFMQECFPYMKEHGGKIINFGSAAGLEGHSNWAAYAAAKEGIRALTRVACHEWGQYKINCNVICPMAGSPHMLEWGKANPGMLDIIVAMIPLKRMGDCERDIGRAVVFLAGPDSDYITGQTLMVDGGQAMLR